MDEEFFPVQCELVGSTLKVPEGPGLGVEFNEELGQGTGIQVLGGTASAAAGWVPYELVMIRKPRDEPCRFNYVIYGEESCKPSSLYA